MKNDDERAIQNLLEKWVSQIIDKENLKKRLKSGKKLRIKFGIDPTGTHVHIWHAVPILKLREFQKLGHQVIILIGDSTAQVGDTSDKEAERPMLTRDETRKNAENYISQFWKILDINNVEIVYNSEWIDKVNFNWVWELAKNFSVAEMLDRDNFSKRYKAGIRISLQEFLYPLMQGYDSVALKADVELWGNDQYFNLLAGRRLQDAFWQPKQDIMAFNLIEWTDGRKMSKTYKNFVGLDEDANSMFVKIMEINDELIIKYFVHCTPLYLEEIEEYEKRLKDGEHPREVKMELAKEIVTLYHNEKTANDAEAYFKKVISGGERPDDKDIETVSVDSDSIQIVSLIREIKMVNNSNEARNSLNSNGVKVDEIEISDPKFEIKLDKKKPVLIQVGKKKFKYVVRK